MDHRATDPRATALATDEVEVPAELSPLVESIAAHIHAVWAARRMASGWTLGPQRDDRARTHPNLVRYDDLPEDEKEYDRQTALETIRALLSLGYRIVPPGGEAGGV